MNKKIKYKLEPRYILMICSVLLVILIFMSYKFQDVFEPLKAKGASFIIPMQKGVSVVGNYVSDISDNFDDIDKLQKENESLRAEYNELLYKYNDLLADSYELEKLRNLFDMREQYKEYDTIAANIIATDTSGYNSVFTIDRGSKDGIAVDMNVIANNALVGIVTNVGENYANIRTIIDDNSNVSATILKTNDPCMVCGNLKLLGRGYAEVIEIPLSSNVTDNYQVVTSSMSSKYLPDLRIGYISNVVKSKDGLSKYAYLTPIVDFERLDMVLVITTVKDNIQTEEE